MRSYQDMERIIIFIHIRIRQAEQMNEYVGGWIFYNIIHKTYHVSVLKNPSLGLVTCHSSNRVPLHTNLSSKEASGTSCSLKTIYLPAYTKTRRFTSSPIPLARKPLTSLSYTHSLPDVGASHLHSPHFLFTYLPRFRPGVLF